MPLATLHPNISEWQDSFSVEDDLWLDPYAATVAGYTLASPDIKGLQIKIPGGLSNNPMFDFIAAMNLSGSSVVFVCDNALKMALDGNPNVKRVA